MTAAFTDDEKLGFIKAHQGDGRLFEDIITCLYKAWCQPGDHVIDAGANRGHHTFQLANLVGPDGQVLAVEPIPALADMIDTQARRHQLRQIRLVTTALGEAHAIAEFFFRRDMDGWSSLFERHRPPNTQDENITRFYTTVITLDDLAHLTSQTRFAKLDLELNEYAALKGAQNLLRRDRPLLAFENAREQAAQIAGYTQEDFFGLFTSIGYQLFDIFMGPFGPDRWRGDPTMPVYNIAVPQEQIERAMALPMREFYAQSVR